jgi:hypothetical protein
LPPEILRAATTDDPSPRPVLEAVWPDRSGIRYAALLTAEPDRPVVLAEGRFAESPCIAFRWLKAPGETYGRGPVKGAARYPHRERSGRDGAEERLHRRHRHLAGGG